MQRVVYGIALLYIAYSTAACMDQGYHDQTPETIAAARHEGAREARLQALEREHAFLVQQVASLSRATNTTRVQDSSEAERDKKLASMSGQIGAIAQMLAAWREEERPKPLDPDAGRIADQVSEADRQAAIRKVQALLDAGRIKLTMRGGRIQITPVRPIDVTNPYEPPPVKAAPTTTPEALQPKRPIDTLGY